ncbi:MAG: 30S ribosomal protein S4e [Candidatus Methanomethylicia archaeon]|nr:30S ribosomal protein S4e [Candidatus Methanomethylicia archaeon]MCX8168953.1 30S ribosomal protein S4e [Candidatus Methanomethylicia archaeon]MDW7988685.1 30S ribosomal protein S4e [Nitrososphaerota archaeon]
MGRRGQPKHLKRFAAPEFWPIPKKAYTFTVRPLAGPHALENSIPLLIIVRDILKYAETAAEAKKIIKRGEILVDGKVRREHKFPVGLMDVISIPKTGENYRVLPDPVKGLILHPISMEEANFKLCRIENKTMVKGGNIQLNLHDGRNILVSIANPADPKEDVYKTLDTLKINLSKREIQAHVSFDEGRQAIIVKGKNRGIYGVIKGIEGPVQRDFKTVLIEDSYGNIYRTSINYVFVIGDTEPLITLPKR